jgi:hypothetical protein
MKTGSHTEDTPCVEYDTAVRLKNLGFDQYTRQSYVGGEFVDWMGWKNSRKFTTEHGFSSKPDSPYKPMVSAPTLITALIWTHTTLYDTTPITIYQPLDWESIEAEVHLNLSIIERQK